MSDRPRIALPSLLVAAAAALGTASAMAQVYPSKPIRLVVPYAPGGATDAMARVYAQKFSAIFRSEVDKFAKLIREANIPQAD